MIRGQCRGWLRAAIVPAAALSLGVTATSTLAATATTIFQVTATVAATCLITATNLAFGIYTVLASSTSTITVTCTNTTTWNVGLNAGPSGALLAYSLSQDAAHTINWGNTVGTETGAGAGTAQALTVFGQAAAGQLVTPGAYVDTITATITF